MAKLTLAGQQVTSNDMLIKGIIDSIAAVNEFYQMLPFSKMNSGYFLDDSSLMGQSTYTTNDKFMDIRRLEPEPCYGA